LLELRDANNHLLQQWAIHSTFDCIEFRIYQTDVLSIFATQQSITLFYGFLDQDYKNNPAQFVAEKINAMGLDGLKDCYGSFVVLHCDLIAQEFFLSNDALGDFAAHYYQKDNCLLISDSPELLLNKTNAEISSERIIHYFALTNPMRDVGFYPNIKQLNPGQYVKISNQQFTHGDYYQPIQWVDYSDKSSEDLARQFTKLLQNAIKYQTQAQERIGIMLSGGMDSTFVTANALKVDKKISAFSYVFPHMPDANESLWIDAMRTLDIEPNTFVGENYWPLKSPVFASINSPYNNPYRPLKDVIYQQAANKGIKIILSGVYADHLYSGYTYWLIEMLKKHPIKAMGLFLSSMKQLGFINSLRQISPKKWSKKMHYSAPWLNSSSKQYLKKWLSSMPATKHLRSIQYALVYSAASAQGIWLDNEHGNRYGVFVRDPFRDRRVIEFMLSLPAWILGRPSNPKALVRLAAKDLLPESIVRRNQRTTLTPLFIKGVLNKEFLKVKSLLTSSDASWQNYVEPNRIQHLLQDSKIANTESDYLLLWQCVSYELWINRLRDL
jgi:asparagine synthase (glutamine-hydrolysing)